MQLDLTQSQTQELALCPFSKQAAGQHNVACCFPGAQVSLKAPISFSNDVRISGNITFLAAQPFPSACLSVAGSLTLQPGAQLRLKNCHNNQSWTPQLQKTYTGYGNGGGLRVHRNLVLQGQLHCQNCHVAGHGGAAYIGGRPVQASVRDVPSHVGLYVVSGAFMNEPEVHSFSAGRLKLLAGLLRAENCSAQGSGGAQLHQCSIVLGAAVKGHTARRKRGQQANSCFVAAWNPFTGCESVTHSEGGLRIRSSSTAVWIMISFTVFP